MGIWVLTGVFRVLKDSSTLTGGPIMAIMLLWKTTVEFLVSVLTGHMSTCALQTIECFEKKKNPVRWALALLN